MIKKLLQLIRDGEGLTVEFKRCENKLSNSVFETVSSFSNRYGGHVILGVEDNGKVYGLNPNSVADMKKNFANILNNLERIDPDNFVPYPRNPILARFFTNIGRADVLGSGVRNLYKFTKIYSGGNPELIDGDVFKIIVPLSHVNGTAIEKTVEKNETSGENVTERVTENQRMILNELEKNERITSEEMSVIIGISSVKIRENLAKLKSKGLIERIGPDKGGYWMVI